MSPLPLRPSSALRLPRLGETRLAGAGEMDGPGALLRGSFGARGKQRKPAVFHWFQREKTAKRHRNSDMKKKFPCGFDQADDELSLLTEGGNEARLALSSLELLDATSQPVSTLSSPRGRCHQIPRHLHHSTGLGHRVKDGFSVALFV